MVSSLRLLAAEEAALCFRVPAKRRLREEERLAFHPCENTWSVAMRSVDFFSRFLPMLGYAPEWVSLDGEEG